MQDTTNPIFTALSAAGPYLLLKFKLFFLNSSKQFKSQMLILIITWLLLISFAFYHILRIQKLKRIAENEYEKQKRIFRNTDPLTNLLNRNGIKSRMETWTDLCRKNSRNGGAVFLDIDNFRSVNNTFGHDSGDEFLKETANRLQKALGSETVIGRIGGDEFAILVDGIDDVAFLEHFCNIVSESFKEPYLMKSNVIQLSCSIGAIFFNYQQLKKENEYDQILNRGEFILQEAKRTQKGGCLIFSEKFDNLIDKYLQLEHALRASIKNDELFCCFQPQYSCSKRKIVGFEALARWKNASLGMISPMQFIPIAEKTGFIKELGRFMMEKSFAFAKGVEGRGLTVSFNCSPVELMQANYTSYLLERFDFYGLKPNSVAVEITESCLIESFEETVKKLQVLHKRGIRIYLDDFGTGFSSLNYLKNLPINAVKVDKSFIDEISSNDVEKDIVNMIGFLARRLKLDVIAEGVENEEQIKSIRECGCDIIQGYFVSKPLPQKEVLSLLDILNADHEKAIT